MQHYLSLVGLQLGSCSVGLPELILQADGVVHVHHVGLLQGLHLPAEIVQVLQLPAVHLHRGLQLAGLVCSGPGGTNSSQKGRLQNSADTHSSQREM